MRHEEQLIQSATAKVVFLTSLSIFFRRVNAFSLELNDTGNTIILLLKVVCLCYDPPVCINTSSCFHLN